MLSEEKLPIKIKQTRRAYFFRYIIVIVLIVFAFLGIFSNVLFEISKVIYLSTGILGFILLIWLEINLLINSIVIDENKVTSSYGVIKVKKTSVYYHQITDIKITQSLRQRLLNYGAIHINTPGHEGYEIVFDKISNPHAIRDFIEKLEHKHAIKRSDQRLIKR
ncbi:MAG: PH domain-containing protein [Nanoarchaeota archaeon]